MDSDLSGRQLGAYRVGKAIGEGGIGQVYQAVHVRTGRSYALKVLMDTDDSALPRFRREAEALSAIGHPGVVAIHDFDESAEGVAFLVMDHLEGSDLARRINHRAMPMDEALDRFDEVADALTAAHNAGVLHRDLKPSNIFLKREGTLPERAVLLDFGLAKSVDPERTRLTATGQTMGTPLYMSPEQALGEELDVRSDVYSLGAVLYEMLCGEPPFDGPTLTAILSKVLMVPPQPLRMRGIDVPSDLEAVLLKALAKGRDARPASVAEFRDLVRRARGRAPVSPQTARALSAPALPPTRATPRFVPERKRKAGMIGAALAILGVAAAVAAGIVLYGESEEGAVVPQEVHSASDPVALAPLSDVPELTPEEVLAESPATDEATMDDATMEEAVVERPTQRRQARSERPASAAVMSTAMGTTMGTTAPPAPTPSQMPNFEAINAANRAQWNATIRDSEGRIAAYEQVNRWLDRTERRGRRAQVVCRTPLDLGDIEATYHPRPVVRARELLCEKYTELQLDATRRAERVDRLRQSFDRARRDIARSNDEQLPPAERAELLRRVDRFERVANQNPFPCFHADEENLASYARELGPQAAQPAIVMARSARSICQLDGHLRDREQRYSESFDRARENTRVGIDAQRDVINRIRELTGI